MRILITNSGRKWIGEVGHCALLQETLRARGHQVWIACRRGFELHDYLRERGLPHLALNFGSRFSPIGDPGDILAMRRFVIANGIQVIHVHRGKDHWIAAFAAPLARVPLIRTRHVVTPVAQHPLNQWLYRFATDGVLSVSRAAESSLGSLGGSIRSGEVILSAVDHKKFHPNKRSTAVRAANVHLPKGEEPVWIGMIGRFQNVKGQKFFLRAAAEVASRCPCAHFLLAGRGGENKRKHFRHFAHENGFGQRLVIEGVLSDLPKIMASLDVGVVASIGSEGSSRVTLEYMASGVPVVATRVGGIPDLLEPTGESPLGRTIPPRDAHALADAIIEVIEQAGATRERTALALEAVRGRHDPSRWAAQIETHYRAVIAARSGEAPALGRC